MISIHLNRGVVDVGNSGMTRPRARLHVSLSGVVQYVRN